MTFREALHGGGPLMGAWLQTNHPVGAEMIGRMGYDWIGIDTQHGLIGYEGMLSMLQAVSVGPSPVVVRVAANDPADITHALDAGAEAVIVPLVETADDARRAVRACRYPPLGERSWGPARTAQLKPGFTPARGNEEAVCIPQLESVRAMENLDAILETPGIDGIYVGPNDLALSARLAPNLRIEDPHHRTLVTRIVDAARTRGITAGTHCPSPEHVREWLDMGFGMLAVYLEMPAVSRAARESLEMAREAARSRHNPGQ